MTKRKANPKPSPWRRGPHCPTKSAALSHVRYVRRGAAK